MRSSPTSAPVTIPPIPPITIKLRLTNVEKPVIFKICDVVMKPVGIFRKSMFMAHFNGRRWSIIHMDSKGKVKPYVVDIASELT